MQYHAASAAAFPTIVRAGHAHALEASPLARDPVDVQIPGMPSPTYGQGSALTSFAVLSARFSNVTRASLPVHILLIVLDQEASADHRSSTNITDLGNALPPGRGVMRACSAADTYTDAALSDVRCLGLGRDYFGGGDQLDITSRPGALGVLQQSGNCWSDNPSVLEQNNNWQGSVEVPAGQQVTADYNFKATCSEEYGAAATVQMTVTMLPTANAPAETFGHKKARLVLFAADGGYMDSGLLDIVVRPQ